MRISVFGIGYVGTVAAACLTDEGHDVVAVDVSGEKVATINAGQTPISEPELPALIETGVARGRLRATTDAAEAIRETDLTFVCVGTPSRHNGNLDLSHVLQACEDIARALRRKDSHHKLVVRSTVLPGMMEGSVIPMLREVTGREPGRAFGIGYYPEFLREGAAVADFRRPAAAVIGRLDDETAAALSDLNRDNGAEVHIVDIATAEAVKYANNSWHALKVSFANEIGAICKASDIDGKAVMSILCSDRKLNISSAYLRPGFAFGGSCLPKDLRALRHHAKLRDVPTPILDATLAVNGYQIERALAMIARSGKRRIAMLGLTFKPDTDDLRESPLVELAERVIGKGYDLVIYDRDLQVAKLIGSNRRYAMQHLPHLSRLLIGDLDEALARSELVVIGSAHSAFRELRARLRADHHVLDLVGQDGEMRQHRAYEGACW